MNTTTTTTASGGAPMPDSSGILGSGNISGFGYGIGVSVGILLLITTITLTSYFCTKNQSVASNARPQRNNATPSDSQNQNYVIEIGLDDATLLTYPKMLFKEAKINHRDSTATCCSICLADYKGSDVLRLLPDCEHLFHLKCVDPWLRVNASCPVCRTSPLPTPQSTPLAEVVPLANRPLR